MDLTIVPAVVTESVTVGGTIAIWVYLARKGRWARFTPRFWRRMLIGSIAFTFAGSLGALSMLISPITELHVVLSYVCDVGILAALGVFIWGSVQEKLQRDSTSS